MIYVGIDVASTKHDCFIANHLGEIYSEPFTIKNNLDGFKQLEKAIKSFSKQTIDLEINIALESTGHFSQNILNYLVQANYKVYQINPILIDAHKKASTIRKTKTDSIDCQIIVSFLEKHLNELVSYQPEESILTEIKALSRHRNFLVSERSKIKIHLKRLVTITFPEYIGIFSSLYIDTSLAILSKFTSPSKISKLEPKDIDAYVKSKSPHCRVNYSKYEKLIEIAKNSIGTKSEAHCLQIKSLINLIKYYNSEIDDLEVQLNMMINKINSNIMTIPGVNTSTGAVLLGEIGNISKFKKADQLVAFAGFDPTIYESGKYKLSNGKMSKRGSRYLRTTIWHISLCLITYDSNFRAFYEKKKKEGMHHNKILGHIGKKFLRVLYSILKNNTKYEITQKNILTNT